MTVRPTHALPSVSLAEMEFLVTRTGLTLNAGQMADLVLAWRQVSALIATIPRETTPADDCAFAFRLRPPVVPQPRKPARPSAPKTEAPKAAPPKVARSKTSAPVRAAAAKAPAAKKQAAKAPAAGGSGRTKPRSRK